MKEALLNRARAAAADADAGVSLIIALVFITVVGTMVGVGLSKAVDTTDQGISFTGRTNSEYALDAGVDRAIQKMRADMAAGQLDCPQAPSTAGTLSDITESGGFAINGKSVHYYCETLAGKVPRLFPPSQADNWAILVTGGADSLTTSNAASRAITIEGSVYLAGNEANSDLKKPVTVTSGDIVQPFGAGRSCNVTGVTQLSVTANSGGQVACTEETLAQAMPNVSLPTAPTNDVTAKKADVTVSGKTCRVFYPGLYTSPPTLGAANYFASGLYYFDLTASAAANHTIAIGNNQDVVAGTAKSGDTAGPTTDCSFMTDSLAKANAPSGVTTSLVTGTGAEWVLGSKAVITMGANSTLTMYSTGDTIPVSLYAPTSSDTGYHAWSGGTDNLVDSNSATPAMLINGMVYAPNGNFHLFASNPTTAVLHGGLVANTVTLDASAAAGSYAFQAPGNGSSNPAPPYRTVRIVAQEPGIGLTATSVVTMDNFGTYAVTVKSWQLG